MKGRHPLALEDNLSGAILGKKEYSESGFGLMAGIQLRIPTPTTAAIGGPTIQPVPATRGGRSLP